MVDGTFYNQGIVGILSYFPIEPINSIIGLVLKTITFLSWIEGAQNNSHYVADRSKYKIVRYDDIFKNLDPNFKLSIDDSPVPRKKAKN